MLTCIFHFNFFHFFVCAQKRLTVTHVSISLYFYLIMKGGNFFTKSIAKIMNIYHKCNDLYQQYS